MSSKQLVYFSENFKMHLNFANHSAIIRRSFYEQALHED